MAESKSGRVYPLAAYNYRVTIGGTAVSFTEVSGLAIEYEKLTYKHGLSFWEGESIKSYRYDKYVPVTLKKGIIKGGKQLYDWLTAMDTRNLDISLCDENGIPVVTWHIGKAVPLKLAAPSFQANTNEVAIETFELMAARITIAYN
jgi:phage tail-like protein